MSPGRMRAAVYDRYGPPEVVVLREVERPTPRDDELLIRIRATTVTSGDSRLRSLRVPVGFGLIVRLVFGVSKPRRRILGTEVAGDVVAVGRNVAKFKVGDAVIAFSDWRMGCHAEYICMPKNGLVIPKPSNLNYEEAAALSFGGTTALDFFRKAKLRRGERVLINGASGAVGCAAVQLARYFGAELTAVCSTANIDLVRSLGAMRVIDYTKEDFTLNGETYDLIVDTVGTAPFPRSKNSLREDGRLLLVQGGLPDILPVIWLWIVSGKRIIASPVSVRVDDLQFLGKLAEQGKLRSVIDRRYKFDQIVEAHRYVDSGRKKGNVVITQ